MAKESHTSAAGQTVVVVKEKRSLLTKIFGFGCLGIIVIIIIVAVASSMGDDKPTNDFPTATSTPTPQKSEYAVGEEVKQDNITLTVTDVQRNYASDNEFSVPESGKEFVRVNVKLVNGSSTGHSYSSADFKIQDSTGNRLYTTYVSGVPNTIDFGELASGGSVVGNLAFEVPKGDKNLKLVFSPSFWGSEVIVKL